MADNQKPKRQSKPKEVTVDKKTKKKILEEQRDKLEKVAEKIALKTMTEMQLATQAPLSDEQKRAVKLIASGKTYDEVAFLLGKRTQEVTAWMGQPSFSMAVNEATIKEGMSDKNERIRKAKRIAESLSDKMIEKIENGELDNVPVSMLSQLAKQWAERVDTLVDKKEEVGQRDLTVLILNHVQGSKGKKFDSLDDFLSDKEDRFPTIDTVASEVEDDQ